MSAPCRSCWLWWGLFYCFWGYLLFDDLWHSRWLSGHCDVVPMFLSLNTALGPCLLLAVKQPAKHRLMIAYGAWSSLAHGFTAFTGTLLM